MGLYSLVDLTGKVNMIEKLVLGGTGSGDLPILSPILSPDQQPNVLTSANLCAIKSHECLWVRFHNLFKSPKFYC